MKFTEINGEQFETVKSKHAEKMIENHMKYYNGRTLNNYYQKPSQIKKKIYEYWREWAIDPHIWAFEVINGSCFMFSIGAIYRNDLGDAIGYIRITKDHNRLFLIK